MSKSFQIITDKTIRDELSKKEFFTLVSPFFLLVKTGEIRIQNETVNQIPESTVSAFAKEEVFKTGYLSEDCECILLEYDRNYIRTMTLKMDLLDAFKYVYSNAHTTFDLPKNDFYDLWILAEYIESQLKDSQHSDLETHIFRHLNYSFLYSCIERMNRNSTFESKPRNQSERVVLNFLTNLQNNAVSKLKVNDYAEMQHLTTRHLSATVKEVTGMAPLQIMHRIIMSKAKDELTQTDKPISEIAFELGYTDPYAFSNFFKKNSGMSPSDFRNNYQG